MAISFVYSNNFSRFLTKKKTEVRVDSAASSGGQETLILVLVKLYQHMHYLKKTIIVLKKQALHMFRPVNRPSSGATIDHSTVKIILTRR